MIEDLTLSQEPRFGNEGPVRYWQPVPEGRPDFICARLEAGPGPLHLHDEWQFAVAEGAATLSVGAFKRYGVCAGDVTVVRPYDVHSEAGWATWRVLYVAQAVMARIVDERSIPSLETLALSNPGAGDELRALLRDSESGMLEGSEFADLALAWLRRLVQHPTRSSAPLRPIRPRPAVERVRAFLRDRPTEPLSLSDAVTVAGIAASHLVRSFSRDVGLPPKSYHAQARLALARRLLAEGKSATWVAYECGFADQSHLSRRFKQCYGLTPGAFQTQCSRREIGEVRSNAA